MGLFELLIGKRIKEKSISHIKGERANFSSNPQRSVIKIGQVNFWTNSSVSSNCFPHRVIYMYMHSYLSIYILQIWGINYKSWNNGVVNKYMKKWFGVSNSLVYVALYDAKTSDVVTCCGI